MTGTRTMSANEARERIASSLCNDGLSSQWLPQYIVQAFADAEVMTDLTVNDVEIDLSPYHRRAYNVASLAVIVEASEPRGSEYWRADTVVFGLAKSLLRWLGQYDGGTDVATVEVDVRTDGRMSGLCMIADTGEVVSAWGACENRKGSIIS